jgi:uncharacterized Fe-S cluster protein YjdI
MIEDRMESKDREYTNGEITVKWQPSKCIHVTTCYRELISVFNPRKRPWVNMQGAPTDEIIRVVKLCPTEALTFHWNNEPQQDVLAHEKQAEAIPAEKKITADIRVMKDGPLLVKGIFKITGSDGVEMKQMRMVSFCRCGNSGKMPFCDGTHRKIGFSAD